MVRSISKASRGALWTVIVALTLNAAFLAINLCSASLSPTRPLAEVRSAFLEGELVDQDYLRGDWRRGWNQYNDCAVLQLAVNEAPSLLDKALAPQMYVSKGPDPQVCQTLRSLVDGTASTSLLLEDSYARYWHGDVPVTSVLLRTMDLRTARVALRLLVVASLIILITVTASTGERVQIAGASIGLTGLLFWGLPYYGQGLSFAPGDATVMAGIAVLVACRELLVGFRLVAFSAAFGSVVTYFDFLTGQIPTAACLLLLFTFVAQLDRPGAAQYSDSSDRRMPIAAVAAFALASVLTVAAKQILVILLIGPDQLAPFVSNLRLYTGLSTGVGPTDTTYFWAIVALIKYTPVLTYYSIFAAVILLAAVFCAWVVGAIFALRAGAGRHRECFLAHAVSACGVLVWSLLLPVHTQLHAGFMVRILVVPIGLGWSALVSSFLSRRVLDRVI